MTEKELKKILRRHQLWLEGKEGGERANLHGAILREADLRGADLRGANLRGAILYMADLYKTSLRRADLRGATLYEADLYEADLYKADLRRAGLRGVDLRGANLRGANLRGANLDYSCWPLWSGSMDVTVDKRIAAQLAYHFCRVRCNDPEVQAAQKVLAPLANQFHWAEECGRIAE